MLLVLPRNSLGGMNIPKLRGSSQSRYVPSLGYRRIKPGACLNDRSVNWLFVHAWRHCSTSRTTDEALGHLFSPRASRIDCDQAAFVTLYDLENLIVYARSVHDLDGDLVSHFGSFDLLVVNLHRGDLLRKVGRVAEKVDLVAHRKLAVGHAHNSNAGLLEVVTYRSD